MRHPKHTPYHDIRILCAILPRCRIRNPIRLTPALVRELAGSPKLAVTVVGDPDMMSSERGTTRNTPDYLPQLQQELLQVIAKYELIDLDQVSVNVDRNDGCEVLELNIVLGDVKKPSAKPVVVAATS